MIKYSLIFLSFLFSLPCYAGDLDFRSEIYFQPRLYRSDNIDQTKDSMLDLSGSLELNYDHGRRGRWKENLQIFAQTDLNNSDRTVGFLQEANINLQQRRYKIGIGDFIFSWTALEAFHPADILNSRYWDSDIKNFIKIGEPAIYYTRYLRSGSLNFYYLPVLTAPILPKSSSRMNILNLTTLPYKEFGPALWLTPDGNIKENNTTPQFAFLWETTLDNADLTIHIVHQMDRSHPLITYIPGETQMRPVYVSVLQLGGTFQMAYDDWVFKSEFAVKDFQDEKITSLGTFKQLDHTAMALGAEYLISHRGGQESSLYMEYQTLVGLTQEEAYSTQFFQNDLFYGWRFSFNDAYSQEVRLSLLVDLSRAHEQLIHFSYKRRLSDTWSMQMGANLVEAFRDDLTPNGLELFSRNNEIFLKISKFF
ncbi:MAG: hypothetical protein KDD50_07070 [Bdellovibrionales bacterium]|nr:hypothetical protein [Bdellovibrionales bacterium]